MSTAISVTPITDFSTIKQMATEGDLWVINNTDKLNENKARGIMTFGVKDTNGDVTPIVLTDTWIPVNMAAKCDPMHCVASQHFRESVGKQAIIVISRDEAIKMLNTPAAKEAQQEVDKFTRGHNAALNIPQTVAGATVSIATSKSAVQMKNVVQPDVAVVESGNSDDRALLRIVGDFNAEMISDDEAVASLLQLNPTADGLKLASSEVKIFTSNLADQISSMISEHKS